MEPFFVVKRDGSNEKVSFDAITIRNEELSHDLQINASLLSQSVIRSLKNGMTTSEIDILASETAMGMSIMEPEYAILASRIACSNLHKKVPSDFLIVLNSMLSFVNRKGKPSPLISRTLVDFVQQHLVEINEAFDYSRDYNFSYFGLKTLEKSYLNKINGDIIERPQHLFMRVALAIHADFRTKNGTILRGNIANVLETYHELSMGKFIHASPTLFNSGSDHQQLSSCFLMTYGDSIKKIYAGLLKTALVSKFGGGVGVCLTSIRSSGSHISSTNGKSDGIIPLMRVMNESAVYVNQSGRRNGAVAIYLEPWHDDILDFLDSRLNTGEEGKKARNLYPALWIPDLFMKRVKKDELWSLFSPSDVNLMDVYGDEFDQLYLQFERNKMYVRQVPAMEIWKKVLISQIETGLPYVMYKDAVNRKSNHSNIGIIRGSNLCVAPETMIMTDQGYFPIFFLQDTEVNIWNGRSFSKTIVRKTGSNVPLLTVMFSNGVSVSCTREHKFPIVRNGSVGMVPTKDLRSGDVLESFELPKIHHRPNSLLIDENRDAYTRGYYSATGVFTLVNTEVGIKKVPTIRLPHLTYKFLLSRLSTTKFLLNRNEGVVYLDSTFEKVVPLEGNPIFKRFWFAGFYDAVRSETGKIYHSNFSLLFGVTLLLQTLGIASSISSVLSVSDDPGKEVFELSLELQNFLIFETFYPCTPTTFESSSPITVTGIVNEERIEDTFCFTEKLRHRGMFNGLCLGQCAEIVQYHDEKTTASCNLASIALPKYIVDNKFDFIELRRIVSIMVKNMNNIIDRNFYPEPSCEENNLNHRPLGIGVQGLADVFAILKLNWDSEGAKLLNKQIFETIYHAALTESVNQSKIHGVYDSYYNSPISNGIFQFDLWNVKPTSLCNWETLREDIKKYGVRNSLLIALMPTLSTASILGNNESTEMFTSNLYVRRVLSGDCPIINKYLYNDLKKLGLWNPNVATMIIEKKGSIQDIEVIPTEIRMLYRTAWEHSQKIIIDMAADRAPFVDQTQSMNIFMRSPTFSSLNSMHFYGWKRGLKTGSYYLHSRAEVAPVQFSIMPTVQQSESITPRNVPVSSQQSPRNTPDGDYCTRTEGCVACSS